MNIGAVIVQVAAAVCCFLLPGCGAADSGQSERLVIFAASSLAQAFQTIQSDFESENPKVKLELNIAGTSQLVAQALDGAPFDVFASADDIQMDRLEEVVLVHSRRTFARNSLSIITYPGNPKRILSLIDLTNPELKVGLCGPNVPLGRYSKEVLGRASLTLRPVTEEPSARALVTKVSSGELDAAIAFASDAFTAANQVVTINIPIELNVTASYPIATATRTLRSRLAETFVAFVLSPSGQKRIREAGFQLP